MTSELPIYFLHGFGSHFEADWVRTGWVDILADFGVSCRALALPGHNDPEASGSPDASAATESTIWSQLAEQRPITAIGFSAGAEYLLRVAVDHPDAFESLILLGLGDRIFEPGQQHALLYALMDDQEPEDLRLRTFWRLAEANASPRRALAAFAGSPRRPLKPFDLSVLECRVLSIVGSQEHVSQELLRSSLPRCLTRTVEGVDHFGLTGNIEVIEQSIEFLDLDESSRTNF